MFFIFLVPPPFTPGGRGKGADAVDAGGGGGVYGDGGGDAEYGGADGSGGADCLQTNGKSRIYR